MSFLRRLLGSNEGEPPDADVPSGDWDEMDERARDLELSRDFQAGLTALQSDQLRYARYAWHPPDQHRGDPSEGESVDPETVDPESVAGSGAADEPDR
jgi:hypothetical protein